MTGIPLTVLSAYAVIWNQTNKSPWVIGGTIGLFIVGVIFASHRVGILCGAFFFVALRWMIAAIGTGERRAIVATIVFAAIPTILLIIDGRRQQPEPPRTTFL